MESFTGAEAGMKSGPRPRFARTGAWPVAIPVLILALVYAASLGFGYVWDDGFEVRRTLAESISRLREHFRPVYYATFAVTNPLFDSPYQHRLINYLLLLATAAAATRLAVREHAPHAPWLVLAIFLHPTFVYPVTWISQRNDLLLLLFIFLALLNVNRTRSLTYLILSDLAKAPFLLHNLWFAIRFRRDGRSAAAAIALLIVPLVLGNLIIFWQDVAAGSSSPMTTFAGSGAWGLATVLTVRGLKVAEGVFLSLVPVAAFYKAVPGWTLLAIVLAYSGAWTLLVASAGGLVTRARGWTYVALASLNSLPFAINSDPRVLGPAIPFLWLGLFLLGSPRKMAAWSLATLVALNAVGTFFNYGISDSGAYDPLASPDYVLCGEREMGLPMERWRCERADFAHAVVRWLNRG